MKASATTDVQLSPLYNVLLNLEPEIRGVAYRFTSDDEFRKIDSVVEVQLVYWDETLQRMHVCAATSIKRVKKWIEAVHAGYEAENYYGFCATLRGLIEACADTFQAVTQVLNPFCVHFATIERALRGEAKKVFLSEQIENVPIHFTFARRLASKEKGRFPESHQAKQVRAYLDSFADDQLVELYSYLCQVSHPSAMSLMPFLLGTEEYPLILHDEHVDRTLNDQILKHHKAKIVSTATAAALPAMCILCLINEFDAPIVEAMRTKDEVVWVVKTGNAVV